MTTAAPQAAQRPLHGILFMCAASTVFPVMNGLVQILSERYPSEQIVWARTLGHLLFIIAVFAPQAGARLFHTSQPRLQFTRSLLLLGSTLCYFSGLKYLPLAQAASISFTAPFIVTLLAVPLLGERLSVARLCAVIAGFIGVLVVIRPGSDAFNWASILIAGSATFYATYQVFTRRVAGYDPPETSAAYSVLFGTIIISLIVPFVWTPVASLVDAAMLVAIGAIGGTGHYFVARAMANAPANIVAPFMYWQIVGSVVVGYLITGTLPDFYVWLGSAIIVAAGVFIGWRETKEKRVVP